MSKVNDTQALVILASESMPMAAKRINIELAKYLTRLCHQQKFTLRSLAKKLGTWRSFVAKI
jgi:hypothetical protein